MENIQIEHVTSYSPELAERIRYLVTLLGSHYQPLSDDDVKTIISSDSTHLIIAKDNRSQTIIGMITLVTYRIPYRMKGWMEDLVVEEAYRGQGIASSLITKTVALAREKGVKSLYFTSKPERESANNLYAKLGFQQHETNVYRLAL